MTDKETAASEAGVKPTTAEPKGPGGRGVGLAAPEPEPTGVGEGEPTSRAGAAYPSVQQLFAGRHPELSRRAIMAAKTLAAKNFPRAVRWLTRVALDDEYARSIGATPSDRIRALGEVLDRCGLPRATTQSVESSSVSATISETRSRPLVPGDAALLDKVQLRLDVLRKQINGVPVEVTE